MDSSEFAKIGRQKVNQITRYITDQAPGMVIAKTLRFIDGNFRAQGWQGASFQRWPAISRKGGTILVKTGALRRSMNYNSAGPGAVRFYSNVPYSGVHNRGFYGSVRVKAHTRAKYGKSKIFAINDFNKSGTRKSRTVTNKIGEAQVPAHTRRMRIKQRQFAPYQGSESPVLNNSITRDIQRQITKILTF